ncbi:hypothetical protein EDB89DRAFT_1994441 [Lactarius sanguifluus]|nr:hypothetical protein EDB89DRAFT_1994441 [Lactarius sanguifluus]
MSSPFFKDLLSLPQPPDDELVDGLPVIQLSEDAGLLNSLISLLYPIPHVVPSSYEKVFALLAACQKYDMESVQSHIRAEIKCGKFPAPVKAEGFSACAIAGSLGLDPELEDASRLTLTTTIADYVQVTTLPFFTYPFLYCTLAVLRPLGDCFQYMRPYYSLLPITVLQRSRSICWEPRQTNAFPNF